MPPRATCPCCGQETDRPVVVDLARNTVTVGDRSVKLHPMQAELMWIFAKAHPAVVSVDSAIRQIYGQRDEPEHAAKTIHVLIYHVRKKLAPFGLRIVSHTTRGYSLALDGADAPQRVFLAANGAAA